MYRSDGHELEISPGDPCPLQLLERLIEIMLPLKILGDCVRGSPLILAIELAPRPLKNDNNLDKTSASAQSYV